MMPNDIESDFDRLRNRRDRFAACFVRFQAAAVTKPAHGQSCSCPCCGYPTLRACGVFEICFLRYWEDDGQDDPHAAEIAGGPNSDYSLTEARQNFEKSFSMYRTNVGGRGQEIDTAAELALKREIVDIFEAMTVVGGREFAFVMASAKVYIRDLNASRNLRYG